MGWMSRTKPNRERISVRGLRDNYNRDLKNLFKSTAISASTGQDHSAISTKRFWRKGCGQPWHVSP